MPPKETETRLMTADGSPVLTESQSITAGGESNGKPSTYYTPASVLVELRQTPQERKETLMHSRNYLTRCVKWIDEAIKALEEEYGE